MRSSLAETPSGPRLVVEHDGTHHELLVASTSCSPTAHPAPTPSVR
ncbi:hypothetical protein KVF89_13000 [Nocardioides carbamazepini]|nr:hypothetical protein [Nocardioides carbamazepini]MCR1783453.1 hypothetical protein [Nocardioides carbamazepini]